MDKKILTCAQATEAAAILFELNTKPEEICSMVGHASLPDSAEDMACIVKEWYGFVQAAIVYALMHNAPAGVVAAYLQSSTALLQTRAGYDVQTAHAFIDQVFTPYMECLVQNRQKDCPALFIHRITGLELSAAPPITVRVVSGVMAMTLCTMLDKVSAYEMLAE